MNAYIQDHPLFSVFVAFIAGWLSNIAPTVYFFQWIIQKVERHYFDVKAQTVRWIF